VLDLLIASVGVLGGEEHDGDDGGDAEEDGEILEAVFSTCQLLHVLNSELGDL